MTNLYPQLTATLAFCISSICFSQSSFPKTYHNSDDGVGFIALDGCVDGQGNVWTVGNITDGAASFPSGFFLTQTDPSGNVIDSRKIDLDMWATNNAGLREVYAHGTNNIIISGNRSENNVFIASYDFLNETIEWQKVIDAENIGFSTSIMHNQAIYWAYSSDSTQTLHKLDLDGDLQWSKEISLPDTLVHLPYIGLSNDSTLILSGHFQANGSTMQGTMTLDTNGNNALALKYGIGTLGQTIRHNGTIYASIDDEGGFALLEIRPQVVACYSGGGLNNLNIFPQGINHQALKSSTILNDSLILMNLATAYNTYESSNKALILNTNNFSNSYAVNATSKLHGIFPLNDDQFYGLYLGPQYGIRDINSQIPHYALFRMSYVGDQWLTEGCEDIFHANIEQKSNPIPQQVLVQVEPYSPFVVFSNLLVEASVILSDNDCPSYFGSLSEQQIANIELGPNPTTDQIMISSPEASLTAITVLDLNGKTMMVQSPKNNNESTLNIHKLPAGIYFIQLDTSAGQLTRKVVKE